jgi:chromosome segregation ATPase
LQYQVDQLQLDLEIEKDFVSTLFLQKKGLESKVVGLRNEIEENNQWFETSNKSINKSDGNKETNEKEMDKLKKKLETAGNMIKEMKNEIKEKNLTRMMISDS